MVDRELLMRAGVSAEDAERLEQAWNALQAATAWDASHTPCVVCTGIYNAGKSTLLNALMGEDIFPTGDIPTTKAVARAEYGGAVYIDTPGLNAEEEDDQETLAAYGSADFILFVSSAQNGGISTAEAGWLKRLGERYTPDSLKQRLIYVLSHSAQVEPEELSGIEARVRGDLERAVGFVPERIFCVDSILFQQGREREAAVLAEGSGIPRLQAYLSERIADADMILTEAQTVEIAARRHELLEQIDHNMRYCQERMDEASGQIRSEDIEALFAETEKKIANEIHPSVTLYGGPDFSYSNKSFEGKDGSSLKRQARDHVRNYAEKEVRAARRAMDKTFRRAREDYGTTEINSEYFKLCDTVNRLLEELQLALAQHGIQVDTIEEIRVCPDVSEVGSELADIFDSADYWSASMYLDVYGDRIEVNQYDNWYEERGLFGLVKSMPKYVIYTHSATSEIYDQISETFNGRVERATDWLNTYYWGPFLKELRAKIEKRMTELRDAAGAGTSSTRENTEKPFLAALAHLSALKEAAPL